MQTIFWAPPDLPSAGLDDPTQRAFVEVSSVRLSTGTAPSLYARHWNSLKRSSSSDSARRRSGQLRWTHRLRTRRSTRSTLSATRSIALAENTAARVDRARLRGHPTLDGGHAGRAPRGTQGHSGPLRCCRGRVGSVPRGVGAEQAPRHQSGARLGKKQGYRAKPLSSHRPTHLPSRTSMSLRAWWSCRHRKARTSSLLP